ncbi:hypothetical protein DWW55_13920 [Paraprevotella clara]|nr:hypothetical protein DWW55_13920 [Paraprevotella clara]
MIFRSPEKNFPICGKRFTRHKLLKTRLLQTKPSTGLTQRASCGWRIINHDTRVSPFPSREHHRPSCESFFNLQFLPLPEAFSWPNGLRSG